MPDNYFTSKLFQNIAVEIEHQELNQKSGENICAYTRYFSSKLNYSDSYLKQLGELEGYWGPKNASYDVLSEDADEVTLRRLSSTRTVRTKNVAGQPTEFIFYTYQFCMPLDIGLSSLSKPLPKDCTVVIRCMKDRASKALMAVTATDEEGHMLDTWNGILKGDQPITLINPHLEVTFFQSDYYDSKLYNHKLGSMKWPFSYRYIMTYNLDTMRDTFEVRIAHGELIL